MCPKALGGFSESTHFKKFNFIFDVFFFNKLIQFAQVCPTVVANPHLKEPAAIVCSGQLAGISVEVEQGSRGTG